MHEDKPLFSAKTTLKLDEDSLHKLIEILDSNVRIIIVSYLFIGITYKKSLSKIRSHAYELPIYGFPPKEFLY